MLWRDGPTPHYGVGRTSPNAWALGSWVHTLTKRGNPKDSATTQTHILGLGLALPNIHSIYDLLQQDHYELGNSRIYKRSFEEDLVTMVCQRPWTRQMTDYIEHLGRLIEHTAAPNVTRLCV